jgi:hypothetical protein
VINELEVADNIQENEQGVAMDDNSNITVTASVSDGNLSNNGPNIINEEVNQEMDIQIPVNPLELELLEAPLLPDEVNHQIGPVIVQGQDQALNMDNFMNLGLGVQNLMMDYHDLDPDSDSDHSSDSDPMQQDNSPPGNQVNEIEFFHFNEVPPEEAQL